MVGPRVIERADAAHRCPPEAVAGARPAKFASPFIAIGVGVAAGAMVEHRIDQHLPGNHRAASVAGHQRQRGGKATAGALAHDHDALDIDAERLGMGDEPREPGIAILDGPGKWGLGRQSIVHRRDQCVVTVGHDARCKVAHLRVADDEAPAVDMIDGWAARRCSGRAADPERDCGRSLGPGNMDNLGRRLRRDQTK